jgi:phenylacetate 2-hydroxylase
LYTFHGVISSTKGFTIGSSPWDESTKNRRTAAGAVLSRPAIWRYSEMFDLETFSLIADTFQDSQHGGEELSIRPYIQRLALNTTLTLCYGIRMGNVCDHLLREILEVGSAISKGQGTTTAPRQIPRILLAKVREKIRNGTDKPCVSAAIIKGEDTKLSDVELSSICLSLVSGGFETIPATLTSCIGSLSTKEGQAFQEQAYQDITRHYPGSMEEAWLASFAEEKVPYVNALVKEAGRYYTASAMNLPRKTTAPVAWDVATIPTKTMIIVNL